MTLVPVSPVSSSLARNVATASKKIETFLDKANNFGDKETARKGLRSALVLILGYVEGLDDPLEIHLISSLSVTEVDVLLSAAKASFKNNVPLKSVNLISPESAVMNSEEDSENRSALFLRKSFSDELELESHLRSALVRQPGDDPHVKLELGEGPEREVLSLDLHQRSVFTADMKVKRQTLPVDLEKVTAVSSVETVGVCQSLLYGPPLLALPTEAVYLSSTEKEDNNCKVHSLYKALSSQASSLVVTSPDSVFLLTPSSDLGPVPSFLWSEALTGSTLLPSPLTTRPRSDGSKEKEKGKVGKLLSQLPYKEQYNPLQYSARIHKSAKPKSRARGRVQNQARTSGQASLLDLGIRITKNSAE